MAEFNEVMEGRLVRFTIGIYRLIPDLPQEITAKTIAVQLARSGLSVSLNYGEARGSESRKDFIHKIKIILKELRETLINLKILHELNFSNSQGKIIPLLSECNELICIFVKTVRTAETNQPKPNT